MERQILTSISGWITCFPSLVMFLLPSSDLPNTSRVEIMLLAERSNATNLVFNSIRVSKYECLASMKMRKFATRTNLGAVLRRKFSSSIGFVASMGDAHLGTCLRRSFFAKIGLPQLFTGFWRGSLSAIIGRLALPCTHFCKGFRSMLHTQTRTSTRGDVKACFAKGLKFVQIVLFSLNQEWNKNKLNNFKSKGLLSMFIPCILQFFVRVIIAAQVTEVFMLPSSQAHSASNVELLGNGTDNLVNSRCFRDGVALRGIMVLHLLNLLTDLVGVLQWGVLASHCSPHYTSSIGFQSSFIPIRQASFSQFKHAINALARQGV